MLSTIKKNFSQQQRLFTRNTQPATSLVSPLKFLRGRSFLSTNDLSSLEFLTLIDTAIAAKPLGAKSLGRPLVEKSIALVFFNSSLRTRVSMTVAITQLGGVAIPLEIGAGTWDMEHLTGVVMDGAKVEHVREAVPVLSQYVDAIAVRSFPKLRNFGEDAADPIIQAFARHASVPVINMESAFWHPCQALADMMTIKEHCGGFNRQKVVLTWANHPKPLPHAVPNSFATAAAQCGVDLWIVYPEGYELDANVIFNLQRKALLQGGTVTLTNDRAAAFAGADIVYAKSWSSRRHYGDSAQDLAQRQTLGDWIVNEDWMQKTNQAAFMHCLPVRRNVVVADEVLDGPRSIVVAQAGNRLHMQKALLAGILGTD